GSPHGVRGAFGGGASFGAAVLVGAAAALGAAAGACARVVATNPSVTARVVATRPETRILMGALLLVSANPITTGQYFKLRTPNLQPLDAARGWPELRRRPTPKTGWNSA